MQNFSDMQLGYIRKHVVYHTHSHTITCIQLYLLGTLQMGFTWTTHTSWCLSFKVLVSYILQYSGVTFDLRNGKFCWNFYVHWRFFTYLRCWHSPSSETPVHVDDHVQQPVLHLSQIAAHYGICNIKKLRIGMGVNSILFAAHKPQFLALLFVGVDVSCREATCLYNHLTI